MEKQHIFLIGFMGTGKSTVAAELSRKLKIRQIEMDDVIAESQGMNINGIFEQYGEAYFRDLESNLITELEKKEQMIVSCGGGAVMRSENVECMKRNGRIILLTALPETVYHRVRNNQERPLLKNNMTVEFIRELMKKRQNVYEAAADMVVETDHKDALQICEEIIAGRAVLE